MRYPLESRKGIATVDAASAELFCTSEDHFKLKVDDSERGAHSADRSVKTRHDGRRQRVSEEG